MLQKLYFLQDLLESFWFWIMRKPAKPALQRWLPETKSYVQGFSVRVERKQGCFLSKSYVRKSQDHPLRIGQKKDIIAGKPGAGDLYVEEYFELIVEYDGTNPLYSNKELPCLERYPLIQSCATKFLSIEIKEEYEDFGGVGWEFGAHGAPRSPEHIVWLRIFVKKDGVKRERSGFGIARRLAKH